MTEQNKQSDTPAPAQHVVVTPLEWTVGDWEFTAQTPFGHYVARESRDQWIMTGLAGGVHNSIEAFQRAANADFEERVRACLNPSPEPNVAGVPEDLLKLTFAIQHNPNCPSQWLVRLPGKSGSIDMKPYRDLIGIVPHQTGDILGFGKTLDEAARAALAASEVKP